MSINDIHSSLDVVENYFLHTVGRQWLDKIPTMSGEVLFGLGEELRRYSDGVPITHATGTLPLPSFFGGWPSANFWSTSDSKLILSTLLYSGSVLGNDVIVDWFSDERQQITRLMHDRNGYILTNPAVSFNGFQTRHFLCNTLPSLFRWKPVIDAGMIKLVPFSKVIHAKKKEIEEISNAVNAILMDKVKELLNFPPSELTQSDVGKGIFVFIPGKSVEQQLRESHIATLARHFARELVIANSLGYQYVSVFPFESFLLECMESKIRKEAPGNNVLRGILCSELDIYEFLSPETVASAASQDGFIELRKEIDQAYSNIPKCASNNEFKEYLKEKESVYITPALKKAKKEISSDRGLNSMSIIGSGFRLGASALKLTDLGGALSFVGSLLALGQALHQKKDTSSIGAWRRIIPRVETKTGYHVASASISSKIVTSGKAREVSSKWPNPSVLKPLEVSVTAGSLLLDAIASNSPAESQSTNDSEEMCHIAPDFRPCTCKSGGTYRDCCRSADDVLKAQQENSVS